MKFRFGRSLFSGSSLFPGSIGALSAASICCGLAMGVMAPAAAQVVKAPRYQGNVEEPTRQLSLPPLPKAITPNGTVVEDVVVRVNDQVISRSDVERAMQQLQSEVAQNSGAAPSEVTTAQKNLLRDMIDQQLLISKAKDLGFNADAEVIRRMDDVRKQNKLGSMEELEAAVKQQGLNFEDFKAQIRNSILTQQVVREQVGRRLQLTQADEQKYYEAHKTEFTQPEQVRLSEILVPLPENATPAEVAQGEKKANSLKSRIMGGEDFAAVAKKDSGGPTAAQGGELGLFKRGALAKVLEDQTFDLKPGESTQPIRTRQGFVILKVTAHDLAGPSPLSTVEPQVQEAIYMQQMQPALRAYLTRLREEAYIDIEPGFVDSGASANETKPVFTSYAPPPVKKKVAKKTVRFVRNGRYGASTPTTRSFASAPSAAKPSVLASPDTTGTRTLTGTEAAPLIDPKTGLAQIPGVNVASNTKQRHVKREKIRFGQAPRESLEGNRGAVETAKGVVSGNPGPGAPVILPGGTMAAGQTAAEAPVEQAAVNENPLTPTPVAQGKTRFSAHVVEAKADRVKTVTAKEKEKELAKPTPESAQEIATAKQQAAPLGLAGDTTKKPAKPKRVKGARKQRLEKKVTRKTQTAAPVDQTANPALAPDAQTPAPVRTPPNSASPANSSVPRGAPSTPDATTLPPVTAPPPGSPPQGQPVPGVNPPQ